MFLSRGDRDVGVAFQTHPGRQAFISSGRKEPRSALESRRVSLGAHWVDSRESSLLRRLVPGIHVACLCAGWCRLCDDYRGVLDRVARELGAAGFAPRWHWIDIEGDSDLVGDLDVETFPPIVVCDT